jgi:hypothetical protein
MQPYPPPQQRVPPSLGLVRHAPTLAFAGAQEQGGPDPPPPPGLSWLPLNALTMLCGCGAALRRSDTGHGMRCPALAAQVTLRHDILE